MNIFIVSVLQWWIEIIMNIQAIDSKYVEYHQES